MRMGDIGRALRWNWVLALTAFLVVIAAGVEAAYLPAKRYAATATIFAQPTNSTLDSTSIAAIQFLLPSISEQVSSPTFTSAVRRRIGGTLHGADLAASVTPGTGIIHVTSTTTRPQRSAAVANAAAHELVDARIFSGVDLRLVKPAIPPTSPSSPRRFEILFASGVLAVIVAVFAALASARMKKRRFNSPQVLRQLQVPILSEIPRTWRVPSIGSASSARRTHDEYAYAFRRLRNTLAQRLPSDTANVAVTAVRRRSGTTSIAANLGRALASLGYSVVLVDCDVRSPSLHEQFGFDLGPGLADVGRGAQPTDVIRSTDVSGLRVITAGTRTNDVSAVIDDALPRVLDSLENHLVLIDAPPVLDAMETPLVAALATFALLVVDARARGRPDVSRAVQELRRPDVTIVGAVLNRVKRADAYIEDSYDELLMVESPS